MNNIPTDTSALPPPHSRRGFALVLVLRFLVLITGLVIAFFTSVTTDTGGNTTRFPNTQDRFSIDSYYRFRVIQTRKFAP